MKIPSFFIWIMLRLNGIICSLDEVKEGRYSTKQKLLSKDKFEKSIVEVNVLLEHSKEIYKEKENRRQQLLDKGKTLLTICGLVIPVLAYLSTLNINLYVFSLTLILLFISIVLLIHLIRITTFVQPSIEDDTISNENNSDSLIRNISYDYYYCSIKNSNVIDYLADVFRASYRTFIICIILTFATYVYLINNKLNLDSSNKEKTNIILENVDSHNTIIKNLDSEDSDTLKNN